MPSWKKLIQSGSSAHLSEVTASGNIIAAGSVSASRISASMDIRNIDEISSNLTPVKNQVLMFNGTEFVSAAPTATFTFSITSFNDNETTTQLIGSGVWREVGAITFNATYLNGPPISAKIEQITGTDVQVSDFTTPFATDTNTVAINYPSNPTNKKQFRLTADDGEDTRTKSETAITFINNRYFGADSSAGSYDSDITGSLTTSLVNSKTLNDSTISSPQNKYVFFLYPKRLGSIGEFTTSKPRISLGTSNSNQVAAGFTRETLEDLRNTRGFEEDYYLYRSINTIADNTTLKMTTNDADNAPLINYVYFGELNKESSGDGTSTYTEADVVNNSNTTPGLRSNLTSQTSLVINATDAEFVYFAYPSRIGALPEATGLIVGTSDSLSDFHFDANVDNELSITNIYGYTEDYFVYVSKNPGFGTTTIKIEP